MKNPVYLPRSVIRTQQKNQQKVSNLNWKDNINRVIVSVINSHDGDVQALVDEIDHWIAEPHVPELERHMALVLVQSVRDHDVPVYDVDDNWEKEEEAE